MAAYDLTQLADQLRADSRDAPLVKAIDLLAGANAVRLDLDEARRALDNIQYLLTERATVISDDVLPWVIEALQTQAILLYCRATHSNPADARMATGEGKLKPAQRRARRQITQLRDKVIAHYGRGMGQPEGHWIEDRVVLQTSPRLHCSFPSLRAGFKAHVIEDLGELVALAQAHCAAVLSTRLTKVIRLVESGLGENDKSLEIKLRRLVFNERDFFGSATPPGSQTSVVVNAPGVPLGILGQSKRVP